MYTVHYIGSSIVIHPVSWAYSEQETVWDRLCRRCGFKHRFCSRKVYRFCTKRIRYMTRSQLCASMPVNVLSYGREATHLSRACSHTLTILSLCQYLRSEIVRKLAQGQGD